MIGRILSIHANFVTVQGDGGVAWTCVMKGLLKKEGVELLVGDWVTLDSFDTANQTARVVQVMPRTSQLTRPKVANVDQAVIVQPVWPQLNTEQLDRLLTHARLAGLSAVICLSKWDLAEPGLEERFLNLYQDTLGYPVLLTTIYQPDRLSRLLVHLHGKMSVLAGVSGAGKSSLMNVLKPGLRLRVGDVSAKTGQGQHTTRHVELLSVAENTWVADAPGFSLLSFTEALPENLSRAFPETEQAECAFDDCLHLDEPGCALVMSEERQAHYRLFMTEAAEAQTQRASTSKKTEYAPKTLNRKGKESIQVLRLKEKNREASRRTQRQQTVWHADKDSL